MPYFAKGELYVRDHGLVTGFSASEIFGIQQMFGEMGEHCPAVKFFYLAGSSSAVDKFLLTERRTKPLM